MKRIAALIVASSLVAGTAHAADEPELEEQPIWTPPVLHGAGLFTVMRLTEAVIWPEPFAHVESWPEHYEQAYTMPPKFDADQAWFEWDEDPWTINVIGHGLLGSELYLRARSCHFGWAGSLAFTAGGSLVWEYVFEANGVRPSAQDLVYTPLIGFGLGEARYRAARALAGARGFGAVLRVIIDPFGEAERALGSPC